MELIEMQYIFKTYRGLISALIFLLVLSMGLNIFSILTIAKIDRTHAEIVEGRANIFEHKINSLDKLLEATGGKIKSLDNHLTEFEAMFEVFTVETTGYAPFDNKSGICNNGDPFHTSTGERPGPEIVAVDPCVFPYGTKMYIPGYGIKKAGDTGGKLRERTWEVLFEGKQHYLIDMYFDTYNAAINHGRKILPVVVKKRF
jgi:3D (Asp-Asp-Asp) domain-containing protein